MNRNMPFYISLVVIQLVVLYCLFMAITRQTMTWFLASAGSVTLLLFVAAAYFLVQSKRAE